VKEPLWLTVEDILAYHGRLLAEFGGSDGVRDAGLLESALGKPKNLFAYAKPSLFELAASYAFGLVKNHPFVDGNKRAGFAAAATFLQVNKFHLVASEVDAVVQTLRLAANDCTEAEYAEWLKQNSRRIVIKIHRT
jgi:death-on-curing protein